MAPKVSIIMSTFNDAGVLPAALESVLEQSFRDFELLIINDASTDNSEQILNNYQSRDNRIIVWSNNTSQGLTANLNSALAKARGQFIARIDSDDVWPDKKKLEKQLAFLASRPDCLLLGSWAEICDSRGNKLYDLKYPIADSEIRKQILRHNCFVHSSVIVRKSALSQAGGYDPSKQYIEDYALWLKLGSLGTMANLPEILVRYRVNPQGITQSRNLQQIKNSLALINQYQNTYPGYFLAQAKWRLQYLLTSIFGSQNLLKLKQIL